jgi:tetratricopeptide (TPR) repeat protein
VISGNSMKLAVRFLFCTLALWGGESAFLLSAQGLNPPAQPAAPAAGSALADGLTALHSNQPSQALADFQKALQSDPGNATANLLAATAALELYQGPLAVQYAEKARQLDPQSWKIHTTLVAAYSAAGMKQQRDQERGVLRQLHSSGAADARQATGFLVEMFQVHGAPGAAANSTTATPASYGVDAVEYFEPMGKFHTYYRFLVRHADGRRVWEIDVQSNDFDERSWARAHSAEAAAGERQFQITGHGDNNKEVDYRMFSGHPDYDNLRALVVSILQAQPPR